MKMANIDHCFDNMFTNPKDSQGVSNSRRVFNAPQLLQVGDDLNLLCVEIPDQRPRRRASVLWGRVRGTGRLFRVHSVEEALAR